MRQVWQAKDGRLFRTEAECTKHEETIPEGFQYKDCCEYAFNVGDIVYHLQPDGIFKYEIISIEHTMEVTKTKRTDFTLFVAQGFLSGENITFKSTESMFIEDWRDYLHFSI